MRAADERRVAVTGIGAVTPLGSTIADMWTGLVAGRSAVDYIRRIDASTFPTTFGAEVRDLDEDRLPANPALLALLDRKNLFGWVTADDALADSGLLRARPARIGVSIGTESRRPDFLRQLAAGTLYPNLEDHLRYAPFVLAAALASRYGLTGPQRFKRSDGARPTPCSRAGATRSSIL